MDFYPKTQPVLPRTKPMQVLVLGLPRTGTTSICAALRVLGLNPYHFSEASKNKNNEHYQLWLKAVRAKYDGIGEPFKGADFDHMLWNYDAVSDDPCCLFVEELVAAYPDAKVILTTRAGDAWVKSMQGYILELLRWRSYDVLAYFDPDFTAPYQALIKRTTAVLTQGYLPGDPSANTALLESFHNHTERVYRVVPEEKVLEFHPRQGWQPLCKFLDLPVPEGEYPHLNSTPEALKLEKSLFWSRWYSVAQHVGQRISIVFLVFLAVVMFQK